MSFHPGSPSMEYSVRFSPSRTCTMSRPDTTTPPSAWSTMPPTPRRFGTTVVMSPSGWRRYTPPPSTSLKYRFPAPSTVGPSTSPYPEASVSTMQGTVARVAARRRRLGRPSSQEPELATATEEGYVGPLSGVRVVEIAGIGPGPFAAMLLSDMGADVVRVDRAQLAGGDPEHPPFDALNRGRRSVGVDLKNPDGVQTVLRLVEQADALSEGFRPGLTER